MANYFNQDTIIYLDGAFVKAADTKMNLYSQSLHYGFAVFEGIRSYRTESGETKIFKAKEHYDRLRVSAETLSLPYGYDNNELIAATYKVLADNNLQDAYIRPLVFVGENMSFNKNTSAHLTIQAWEMGAFLGDKLLRIMTSSFERPNPKGFKIHAKASGHYVNSIMASQEAKSMGYDEALLTDMNGFVAEGPGANMFYEKDGKLFTPSLGNILPGITRATVLEICQALAIPVEEKFFTVHDVYAADAAFFCGTAAEVIGWESLDGKPFAKNWNDTLSCKVQQAYSSLIVEKK